MPDYSAGSATVRIRPSADGFLSDLNRQLRAVKDPGFAVRVEADVDPAQRNTRAWREEESRKDIGVDVDVDTKGAGAHMGEWRREQESRNLTIKVDVDVKQANAQLASVRRNVEGISRSDVFKLNLGAVGIGAVQPATAGLVQLAAGLQQVSQAALVVPGAISGAVASIGTLAVGLGGVKDAYDAVSKASASSGEDQASQARAAASASNQLRNAVVDESRARKDQAQAYRDARNGLRDLNVEMRGGLISESRALLEATKAREDLAKGGYSDYRDAVLRVAEADQRVIEVRARNADVSAKLNDANAKGIQNSDQVVAANERVTRSQQQVAEAQGAVAASAGKQSAAQKAAAKAMDRLSPSAQKFVQKLVDMKPLWDGLRNSAQEPLFEGKAEEFEKFANDLAPHFEQGMSRISAAWNDNVSALFTTLGSDTGTGLIDRILGNTGEAQERLSKAIDPLVRGIGTLSAAGTDALPRLADAIGNASARFANFIEAADQDGRLEKWINDGLDGMTSLGNSVLNIGKAFTDITQAAGGGASFLQWLEGATDRLHQFLSSAEGQEKLKEFFRDGLEQLQHWGELLAKLPGAFKSMSDGVQPYVGTLIDLFKTLADLVGDHPDLVKAIVTAYLTWKTINPVITGVQNSLGLISSGLTGIGTGFVRTRDTARTAMADVDSTFQKVGKGGSGLSKFSGKLSALGGSAAGAGIMGALATIAIPVLVQALGELDRANEMSETKTRLLEQAQKDLEATVDRVSGKLTAQSRDALIDRSQNYDTTGTAGGGIPGISQGSALDAATSLGIAPDLYIDAQAGNPEALQKVRDILVKNNLTPELNANPVLGQRFTDIRGATKDKLSNEDIINALLGDQSSVSKYNEAFEGTGIDSKTSKYSLSEIAQMLSPTGQASVLAGGRLNEALQSLQGLGGPTTQANQANFGRFRIKGGAGGPFPENAQVNSSGTDYKVTVPGNLAGQLELQGIPYIVNPGDESLTATVPIDSPYIEKYEKGGMVPGAGPRVAIVHGGELVVPAPEVRALTAGRSFETGGTVDEYGNPVQPGAAPGPAMPAGGLIAGNPTSGGGGLVQSLIGGITSGVQGPISNAIGLVSSLPGVTEGIQGLGSSISLPSMPAMSQAGTPGGNFASQMAGMPGLAGLFGGLASPDPTGALTQWGGQTLNWLGNFGVNTASSAASILSQGGLNAVGLGGSVLSPSNPYNQAAQQVAGFALGSDGPLAALTGGGGRSAAGLVDPAALASQYGVTLDKATLDALYGGTAPNILPANLSELKPRLGGEGGLQLNTINAKRAIETAFPQITNIGGVRADRLKWHPNGLAIDVMIPGAGGLNDPTPPEGKALGDQIYAYAMAHKDELGIDYIMWQEKDHYNHLHINTTGGGYPGMADGGPTPSRRGPGPTGGYLAEVHPDEYMISARGRATLPDEFWHKANMGMISPKDVAGFALGGGVQIRQGVVVPPPRPNFDVPNARTITPPRPSAPGPAAGPPAAQAPATVAPASPPTPAPIAPQQPAPTPTTVAPPKILAKNPGASGINHNIGWVDQLIDSSAQNLGQLASTAMSIAAMGAGGAGVPGAGAIGAAGPFVAGLFQQGGKVVKAAANVVSSSLVGNVPGSFGGEAGANPSGNTVLAEQAFPDGRMGGGNRSYQFNGISDVNRLMDRMELADKVSFQSEMANHFK